MWDLTTFTDTDFQASIRFSKNFMGSKNILEPLHGCYFCAWKQFDRSPVICACRHFEPLTQVFLTLFGKLIRKRIFQNKQNAADFRVATNYTHSSQPLSEWQPITFIVLNLFQYEAMALYISSDLRRYQLVYLM